jgi:hypothetical protein
MPRQVRLVGEAALQRDPRDRLRSRGQLGAGARAAALHQVVVRRGAQRASESEHEEAD